MNRKEFNNKKHRGRYLVLTAFFRQEGEVWTAECKELGTATFGDTFEEAKDSFKEAIELHLNTLEDVGECERFLRENGIKVYEIPPKMTGFTNLPIDPNIFVNKNIHVLLNSTCLKNE